MTYPWPFHAFVRPSNHPWAWVCVLHTKRLKEMAYNLAFLSACPTIWVFFFFFAFFFHFFSKVRVGAKEGGSHYWEMAVAITCGYGGYLLPLLAAHSSYHLVYYNNELIQIWALGLEFLLFLTDFDSSNVSQTVCVAILLCRRAMIFLLSMVGTKNFIETHIAIQGTIFSYCRLLDSPQY